MKLIAQLPFNEFVPEELPIGQINKAPKSKNLNSFPADISFKSAFEIN